MWDVGCCSSQIERENFRAFVRTEVTAVKTLTLDTLYGGISEFRLKNKTEHA